MSGVFPCHLSGNGGRFRGPALNCKEPHPTPPPPALVLGVMGIMRQGRTLWF